MGKSYIDESLESTLLLGRVRRSDIAVIWIQWGFICGADFMMVSTWWRYGLGLSVVGRGCLYKRLLERGLVFGANASAPVSRISSLSTRASIWGLCMHLPLSLFMSVTT